MVLYALIITLFYTLNYEFVMYSANNTITKFVINGGTIMNLILAFGNCPVVGIGVCRGSQTGYKAYVIDAHSPEVQILKPLPILITTIGRYEYVY